MIDFEINDTLEKIAAINDRRRGPLTAVMIVPPGFVVRMAPQTKDKSPENREAGCKTFV